MAGGVWIKSIITCAAYWRGVAEGKAQAGSKGAEPEPVAKPAQPKLSRDDFETDEEYLDARLEQKLAEREKATSRKVGYDTIIGDIFALSRGCLISSPSWQVEPLVKTVEKGVN